MSEVISVPVAAMSPVEQAAVEWRNAKVIMENLTADLDLAQEAYSKLQDDLDKARNDETMARKKLLDVAMDN